MSGATAKRGNDFVSEVDLASQRAALDVIRSRHPEHAILAEEEDGQAAPPCEAGFDAPLWIVDPLDGTTNFLHGHPVFGSSVAVWLGDRPVVGAVTAACTAERWWAAEGLGAAYSVTHDTVREHRLRTSTTTTMADALIGTGFPFKAPELLPSYMGQFERVLRSCSGIRRCGAAAIDLCYLAMGRLDAFWEGTLNVWDIAAGLVILSEAGGVATRPDGSTLDLGPGPVLAANGRRLHGELGALLESAPVP